MSEFQWGVQIPEPDINESGEFFGVLDKMEAKKRCKPYVVRL